MSRVCRAPLQTPTRVAPTRPPAPAASGLPWRRCACGGTSGLGGECAECRERRLRRRSTDRGEPPSAPPIVREVLGSPGESLGGATRAFMESCFGHDFGRVRVHTDAKAAESARAVNALAYTVGSSIVFGAGKYAPDTVEGRNLLGHELTHVVQQGGTRDASPSASGPISLPPQEIELGRAGDDLERRADAVAHTISGLGLPVQRMVSAPYRNGAPVAQRAPVTGSVAGSTSFGASTLPYRQASELLECIRIRGEENAATCRETVLGEAPPPPVATWRYGSGPPPHRDYVEVPEDDKAAVEAGMGIVEMIVDGKIPGDSESCRSFFELNCPNGKSTTLAVLFHNTILWKDTEKSRKLLGSSHAPNHVAYASRLLELGDVAFASTVIHELIHNCGETSHRVGDAAKVACGLPDIRD